jgi:hypothetical protein
MSGSGHSQTFSGSDIKFLLTFIAGMSGFWLSGHLPRYLPKGLIPHNAAGAIISLVLALLIYGLVMAGWSWLILGRDRSLKGSLVAGVLAMVLALATSLTLTYTKLGAPHTKTGLALLIFGLYLAYGIYFVIGWATAKRLAK